MSTKRLVPLFPAVAALLVYASTLGAGYLYDDETLIRTNRWVHDAGLLWQLPVKPLLASPGAGNTNYYRPAVSLAYNLMWQLLGGRPLAFHALSVLVHMLNATLLMKLIRRLTGARDLVAVGAAVLFAVHPLNSEAVAWPSCLPELGYVAFGLSALLLHAGSWSAEGTRATRDRAGAVVLFGLACACKETALVLVPLIVLLEWWLRPGAAPRTRGGILDASRGAVPFLGAAAIYLVLRSAILGGLIPRGAQGMRTALESLWSAPGLLLLYARMMLFPSPLLVEHVVKLAKSPADPTFILGAALVGAGVAAVLTLRRPRPDLAFAACLAVAPLLPALYLPALGRDPFAERYAYLGVAGFCWVVAGGAEALASRAARPAPPWLLPALVYVVSIAAAARTVRRCGDWFDDGMLGGASVRDEPRAAIGYLLEGGWLEREGRKEEAWRIYRDGLEHVPQNVELQKNAIGLDVELHHLTRDAVLAEYERLVPLSRESAPAEFNLGHALLEGGRLDAAQAAFARALELAPTSVASMIPLAEIALRKGDAATAAALLERAVRTDPKSADALERLGEAYERAGRIDDARRAWERALALDPGRSSARRHVERLGSPSR